MSAKNAHNNSRLLKSFLYIFVAIIVLSSQCINAYAAVDDFLDKFAANNIMFYDPDDCVTDCRIECVGSNGSDVTVIGDSILEDNITKQKLKDKLSGLTDDSYDALHSRTWAEGLEVAKTMKLKDILVFELSTNNDAITAEQLNDLLDITGKDRTVILITPYSATNSTLQSGYNGTAELFKQTATSNSQIKVVDWASEAKNANFQLQDNTSSRVHPSNDEERDKFASLIASAIGGSCNSGEAVISGTTAEEKVWSGFISLGYTPAQAAGIMGNIAHEGLMNPAQWQIGDSHKIDYGKTFRQLYDSQNPNDTGMGLVAFTYYKYFDILDNYYKEKAPDLLQYLEGYDSNMKYSYKDDGSPYCPGTSCFLEKDDISDDIANRLYSTEITIINDVVRGKYKDSHGFDYSEYFNCDTPADCAEWWLTHYEKPADIPGTRPGRIADAEKFYNEYKDKTSFGAGSTGGSSGSNCGGTNAATAFHKYNFTDGQLRGILNIAKHENGGSLDAIKTEISIMANLFEYYGPKLGESDNEAGFLHYIQRKPGSENGWFATYDEYDENASVSDEELNAAKDILNNGNRTIPPQILEHDYLGDIKSITVDGKTYTDRASINDRSKYKVNETKIVALGDPYIFYTWADPANNSGDPFGYFENNPPDGDFSAASTQSANSATTAVNVKWTDGWITSGFDGYTKGTPEMAGLTVTDSSITTEFATNSPKTGSAGPNKILLHNTEGTNSVGQYGLDIYRGNPYPPHFTIDLKEKKLYQHFSINKPAAAVASVDRTAGIQIEIIGFSTEASKDSDWYLFNSENFGDEEWKYLAKLLVAISEQTGIKLQSSVNWTDRTDSSRLSDEEFKKYEGVLGHQHAPQNDHIDPGDVWSLLQKHFNGLVANQDLTCGDQQAVAADFEWYGQCDPQWGDTAYGSCGTTCSSGCGVVSFTMMAQALTHTKLDPAEVTKNAGGKGLHICGSGSSHSLPETLGPDYGIEVEVLGSTSIDELSARLREGYMIWTCGSGANPYTSGGHCIGVRGITADGKWLLADSNGGAKGSGSKGEKNSLETEWDPNDVFPGMNNYRILKAK